MLKHCSELHWQVIHHSTQQCTELCCTAIHFPTVHWTVLHCSVLLSSTSLPSSGWNQGAVLCSREGSSPEEALYWPLLHKEAGSWCRAGGLDSDTSVRSAPILLPYTVLCGFCEANIYFMCCAPQTITYYAIIVQRKTKQKYTNLYLYKLLKYKF